MNELTLVLPTLRFVTKSNSVRWRVRECNPPAPAERGLFDDATDASDGAKFEMLLEVDGETFTYPLYTLSVPMLEQAAVMLATDREVRVIERAVSTNNDGLVLRS